MNKANSTSMWVLRHKCIIFIAFFVAEIAFFDHNCLLNRYRFNRQKAELNADLQKYRQISKNNIRQLQALEKDPAYIERIARERYFMKTEDEDIYVVEYPEQENANTSINQ